MSSACGSIPFSSAAAGAKPANISLGTLPSLAMMGLAAAEAPPLDTPRSFRTAVATASTGIPASVKPSTVNATLLSSTESTVFDHDCAGRSCDPHGQSRRAIDQIGLMFTSSRIDGREKITVPMALRRRLRHT